MNDASSAWSNLQLEADGDVVVIRIGPPPTNLLSSTTLRQLGEALEMLENDAAVRAIVITGAGDAAFAGGADIREFLGVTSVDDVIALIDLGAQTFDRIEWCSKPVIAAVNGMCAGGAAELALACDVRIASSDAVFSQPEVMLGIVADWGATHRLAQLCGRGRALSLLLTGEQLSAQQAERYNIFERVVAAPDVVTTAVALAKAMARFTPESLAGIKRAVATSLVGGPLAGMEEARTATAAIASAPEIRERVAAFLSNLRRR